MTKEEMAQHFAEQKAEELKEMLKDAFLKGYEQGALQTACSISIEGVKYYDLGLPSGTLWSEPLTDDKGKNYYIFSRGDALKYEGLATLEQWDEMESICKSLKKFDNIGPTGESIWLGRGIGDKIAWNECGFWVRTTKKDEEKSDTERGFFPIAYAKYNIELGHLSMDKSYFAGYKLPIMLTKRKEDIIEG